MVVSLDKETAKEFGYDLKSERDKYLDQLSKSNDKLDPKAGRSFDQAPDKGLEVSY